jgi:hypothetical protein
LFGLDFTTPLKGIRIVTITIIIIIQPSAFILACFCFRSDRSR